MFKKNLYLVTYKSSNESCIHVYGGSMADAIKNFWSWADEYVKVHGVHLDIVEIKLVGTVLVKLAPGS